MFIVVTIIIFVVYLYFFINFIRKTIKRPIIFFVKTYNYKNKKYFYSIFFLEKLLPWLSLKYKYKNLHF